MGSIATDGSTATDASNVTLLRRLGPAMPARPRTCCCWSPAPDVRSDVSKIGRPRRAALALRAERHAGTGNGQNRPHANW